MTAPEGTVVVEATLAYNNGRVCFESSVPIDRGNPYRKGSTKWMEFRDGWLDAEARAQKEAA